MNTGIKTCHICGELAGATQARCNQCGQKLNGYSEYWVMAVCLVLYVVVGFGVTWWLQMDTLKALGQI